MNEFIACFPGGSNTKKAVSVLFHSLTERLDSPQAMLPVGEAVPLFAALLQLAGELEEILVIHNQRLAAYEAAVGLSNVNHIKSSGPEGLS
jgi:hypothetical protein